MDSNNDTIEHMFVKKGENVPTSSKNILGIFKKPQPKITAKAKAEIKAEIKARAEAKKEEPNYVLYGGIAGGVVLVFIILFFLFR